MREPAERLTADELLRYSPEEGRLRLIRDDRETIEDLYEKLDLAKTLRRDLLDEIIDLHVRLLNAEALILELVHTRTALHQQNETFRRMAQTERRSVARA